VTTKFFIFLFCVAILQEAGLLEDEDDENLEMNMETFGAASMAEVEHGLVADKMMSLEEIEAGFNKGKKISYMFVVVNIV
jgi:hypothetical protein